MVLATGKPINGIQCFPNFAVFFGPHQENYLGDGYSGDMVSCNAREPRASLTSRLGPDGPVRKLRSRAVR